MKFIHFLAIFLLFACNGDDLEFAFRMEYPNQSFEIPAGINPFESHYFVLRDIPTVKDFWFDGFQDEDITEISALTALLSSREGISINFGFIEEISVRICEEVPFSEQDAIDRCRREIFYRENIPVNIRNEIELIPNGLNLKDALTKDEFSVVVVLRRLRDFPPTSVNMRFDMSFQARRSE